jgi:hypothetical protein
MRRGDFEAAWRISDRMMRNRHGQPCHALPRHHQWIWDGSPIDDRDVLVRCYHGLGDTIQFWRYLPLLRARARRVTAWAPPRLLPLVATTNACDLLLPLHDGTPGVDYEVDVEIMELPYLFRTRADSVPVTIPYFNVTPLPLPRRRGQLAVGIVWSAGDWNANRSIPIDMLTPLFDLPVDWYVLQGGAAAAALPHGIGIGVGADDIMEAARAIRSLNLLITIDSMPAHLAGALGTRAWTLLPFDADWRWMIERDDSPWYPTMRLFRQQQPGDWAGVMSEVTAQLRTAIGCEGVSDDSEERRPALG